MRQAEVLHWAWASPSAPSLAGGAAAGAAPAPALALEPFVTAPAPPPPVPRWVSPVVEIHQVAAFSAAAAAPQPQRQTSGWRCVPREGARHRWPTSPREALPLRGPCWLHSVRMRMRASIRVALRLHLTPRAPLGLHSFTHLAAHLAESVLGNSLGAETEDVVILAIGSTAA